MSLILKHSGFIFSFMVIIALAVIFIGTGDGSIKEQGKSQHLKQSGKTDNLYKMYFNFDGNRSQILYLIKGKAELRMVYTGKTKFNAKLMSTDGAFISLLADENGPYDQIQIIDIPETGSYLLDVKMTDELTASG